MTGSVARFGKSRSPSSRVCLATPRSAFKGAVTKIEGKEGTHNVIVEREVKRLAHVEAAI
jgi:hypothetical protein